MNRCHRNETMNLLALLMPCYCRGFPARRPPPRRPSVEMFAGPITPVLVWGWAVPTGAIAAVVENRCSTGLAPRASACPREA